MWNNEIQEEPIILRKQVLDQKPFGLISYWLFRYFVGVGYGPKMKANLPVVRVLR